MYMPSSAREERRDVPVAAMRDIQFAALVSSGLDGLHASHLPVLLREGDDLVIEAHVAKGNPHWKLNQHKSDADRAGVVSGLAADERLGAQAVSAQMQALEAGRRAGGR